MSSVTSPRGSRSRLVENGHGHVVERVAAGDRFAFCEPEPLPGLDRDAVQLDVAARDRHRARSDRANCFAERLDVRLRIGRGIERDEAASPDWIDRVGTTRTFFDE